MPDYPLVRHREVAFETPWFALVRKDVQLGDDGQIEAYYAVDAPDFVSTCARTAGGLILLVRQYRPSVETSTWEFPAGTLDRGEDALVCCERELYEETGHRATRTRALGSFNVDLGRFMNRFHCYYSDVGERDPHWRSEPAVECRAFPASEIERMVACGEIADIKHVALWHLATSAGLIALR